MRHPNRAAKPRPGRGVATVAATAGQRIPANAIKGGTELGNMNTGATLYICRAAHNGTLHPGKLISGHCNIGYAGRELVLPEYEVATGTGYWGKPKPNYAGALIGGSETERKLYVCRAHYRDSGNAKGQHPGKIVDGKCNFGYGSREVRSDDFEVFYPQGTGTMVAGSDRSGGGAVFIPAGSAMRIEFLSELSTDLVRPGDRFSVRVIEPREYKGGMIDGRVSSVLRKPAELQLAFDEIRLGNNRTASLNAQLVVVGRVNLASGQQVTLRAGETTRMR